MDNVCISTNVPQDVYDFIEAQAKENLVTKSAIMRQILAAAVRDQKQLLFSKATQATSVPDVSKQEGSTDE